MHVDTSDCNLSRFSLLLVNRNLPDLQILSCGSSERVRHLQDCETALTPLELVEDVDISVNVLTLVICSTGRPICMIHSATTGDPLATGASLEDGLSSGCFCFLFS